MKKITTLANSKRYNIEIISISAVILYLCVIFVNALANILPINDLNTGQISDIYANLFAPAGVTFSIWGVIYILLGLYCLYQLGLIGGQKEDKEQELINEVNKFFILSSVANILWILAWHYLYIVSTVIIMLVLLVSLIKIADILNNSRLNTQQNIFIKIPFGVYFGWITVATIANITAYLVSINWQGFGISDANWTIIILIVGAIIGILRTLWDKNAAYGLVFVWAYFGIWLKHTSEIGFNNSYPEIINTVILLILAFLTVNAYLLSKHFRSSKK